MSYNAIFIDASGQNSLLGTTKSTFGVYNETINFVDDVWVEISGLGLTSLNSAVVFNPAITCRGAYENGSLFLKTKYNVNALVTVVKTI
jgi:hypothetical protein